MTSPRDGCAVKSVISNSCFVRHYKGASAFFSVLLPCTPRGLLILWFADDRALLYALADSSKEHSPGYMSWDSTLQSPQANKVAFFSRPEPERFDHTVPGSGCELAPQALSGSPVAPKQPEAVRVSLLVLLQFVVYMFTGPICVCVCAECSRPKILPLLNYIP